MKINIYDYIKNKNKKVKKILYNLDDIKNIYKNNKIIDIYDIKEPIYEYDNKRFLFYKEKIEYNFIFKNYSIWNEIYHIKKYIQIIIYSYIIKNNITINFYDKNGYLNEKKFYEFVNNSISNYNKIMKYYKILNEENNNIVSNCEIIFNNGKRMLLTIYSQNMKSCNFYRLHSKISIYLFDNLMDEFIFIKDYYIPNKLQRTIESVYLEWI